MKDENIQNPSEFKLEIPIVNFPEDAPIGTKASGWFDGLTGGHSGKFYLKFNWSQHKTSDSSSTIYADLYKWSIHTIGGSALSGSHLTINGSRKNYTGSLSGSGDKIMCSHSTSVNHTTSIGININGALVFNGTFNGTYFGTISGSQTCYLDPVINPFPYIKVGGHYRKAKAMWVKVGGHYRPVKTLYVKANGHYRVAK